MNEIESLAAELLRRAGQRLTSGRHALIDTLAAAGRPLTIPMIMEARPALAQSSVYRNLAVLQSAGIVTRIALGDDHAHFELSEGVTGLHHHHRVCIECGTVDQVRLPDSVETELVAALEAAAGARSFEAMGHRLDIMGFCAACDHG